MRAGGGRGSRSEGGWRGKEEWADEEWDEGVPNVDVEAYGIEENAELLAGTKVHNTDARVCSKVRLLTHNVDMDLHVSEEIEENSLVQKSNADTVN